MPNVSRPDLLPLAKALRLGLPFHGFCKNGKLSLPDSSQMDYLQPAGADLTYVEHPKALAPTKTPSETAFDAARNYQWLPYAYVSGSDRAIGGTSLREQSDSGYEYWLYCGDTRTFLIESHILQYGSQVTLVISAKEFGRFGVPQSEFAEIDRYTFNIKDYNNVAVTDVVSYLGLTHNKTGSITVINFSGGTTNFGATFGLAAAVKIVVAGDAAGELSVSGSVLAVGSQLATVTSTVSTVESFIYYGAAVVCGTEGEDCVIESNVWNVRNDGDVRVTVSEASYDPTFPATYHAAYSYSFYSNDPLEGEYVDLQEVDARVYYYVLPNGTVGSIDATYKTGEETYYTATIPEEVASGQYDWTAGSDPVYTEPMIVSGIVTKEAWDGVSATVGGQSWSVRVAESCATTVNIRYEFSHYYDASFDWSDTYLVGKPFCYYSSVTTQSGSTGTYQPQWIVGTEEEARVNIGDEGDHPVVFLYCNNILDVYHFQDYGNKYHYLYSVTISGKTFSRFRDRVGDTYRLYPAIWDPRTDTVTLGDPGDSLSII